MCNKNDIIEEIARNKLIEELIKNMGIKANDKDDLLQEIYLVLLEYDENKIIKLYNNNQLKFFIVRIIQNQYFSKNSPFYTKYKKYYKLIDENKKINTEIEDE
jgi:hypothetical protein